MAKIQELSERLANQIAAGEVVERPASVVKELVENAIDAGSTQIDILLEEAGLRKIQVTDNGEGILTEDVENAFKRHATSKIHTRDDLFRIRTLGFRGEALPSIASVSEVTLETAAESEASGTRLVLRGGEVLERVPGALRKGTKITVANLFFNTPARLKYVKTIQTELANVGDIVNRLALSHPDIAFRLVHEGHQMVATTGSGDLKQAIAGIYGLPTAKKMLPLAAEDLDFQVSGYISLPEVTRAGRNYLSTIVNGRYIKNFALNKAIVNGYGSKLMVGRFPIAVIEIKMDPLLVDVNVHPTKQEVRLSKEKELMSLIEKAISEALRSEELIPSALDNLGFKKKVPPTKVQQEELPLETSSGLHYTPNRGFFVAESETKSAASEPPKSFSEPPVFHDEPTPLVSPDFSSEFLQPAESLASDHQAMTDDESVDWEELAEHPEFDLNDPACERALEKATEVLEHEEKRHFPELEYFGQMHGTYLFAQSKTGLYVIDQHAAQERIKYEFYREQIGKVSDDLQELLIPLIFDYPASEAVKIREQRDLLTEVGIHLEDFGQNSFVVRMHPTWYPKGEEEAVIREMIDTLLLTGTISVKKFREATAIMMSCKRSIKANHHLDALQARALLAELSKCDNPFNCPHGRPVLVHFSNQDMEKMFKRIQDPH